MLPFSEHISCLINLEAFSFLTEKKIAIFDVFSFRFERMCMEQLWDRQTDGRTDTRSLLYAFR